MTQPRLEPLWQIVTSDGVAVVEVCTSEKGYIVRDRAGDLHGGLYVGSLARDVVVGVAAILAATHRRREVVP